MILVPEGDIKLVVDSFGVSPMADAVAHFDWSQTSLGPLSAWPASLRTAVSLALRSPLAITILWGDRGVMIFNDAYAIVAGNKRSTALGASVLDVWPEAADFNRSVLVTVLGGQSLSYREQEFLLDRDGAAQRAFFDLNFSPITDESGRPAGVFSAVVETTDRMARFEAAAQSAAASARDRNRIWSLSQELMLVCDFNGDISDINPSATRMLGWLPEQMVGRNLNEFVHPDDVAGTAAEVAKLAQGHTTLLFENRYRNKDGSYRLLAWTAVPEGSHIHAVARDITRERSAEEALRQSQKLDAIGQLTGGVAHDFNNVLAVIRNSIEVLKRLPASDERRPRFIEAISNAVTRASKLTGQLLAFARRQALQPQVFDAGQNTRAVSEMISSLAGVRIEIRLMLPEQPCYINADPSQFDTALINLAVNARDAMFEKGRLTIRVYPSQGVPAMGLHGVIDGDFVAISINDTGTGIAAEHLSQIFEPFFTTKAIGVGTGLGLSQVFGFAKQSGGDIRVESTAGKGSTFTLYLPRAARPGQQATLEGVQRQTAQGSGCLLVVEDNPDVAVSVRETLGVLGYATVAVSSAEQALAELRQDANRFAAVFSDVVMSGMTGIELAGEIKRFYGALPVVLTSGYSYVLAQQSDHDYTLLPKPYSVENLAHVLHRVIHQGDSGYRVRRASDSASLHLRDARDEQARLAELARLEIMDSAEDATLNELTQLAARFCDTPVALISLVDDKRQWFKAKVGLEASETPREYAFCAHAIQSPDHVTVVPNAILDPRFATNPLVTADPNIRFYAGAPLVTTSGHALGTLCVIDTVPRELDARQLEVLQFLAARITERFEST